MKRCPTCQRTYEDDLRFCLEDGAWLHSIEDPAKSPPATLRITPQQTDQVTPAAVSQRDATRKPPSPAIRTVLPWTIAGVAILLLMVMGIVVIIVLIVTQKSDNRTANSQNNNSSSRSTPKPSAGPIQVGGTNWGGLDSTGKNYSYKFNLDGTVNDSAKSKWEQAGNKVTWEMYDGYSHFQGTLIEGRLEFTAYNVNNFKWSGSFTKVP